MSSGGKGGSGGQVVGYEYYLGLHFVLCTAPIDSITEMQMADREFFKGEIKSGTITINNRGLFGGHPREGGVAGDIDIESGLSTQGQNAYLVSNLGSSVPNFRGVVSAVFKKFYIGINPYIKKIKFRCSRVHTTTDNAVQWYDSKAGINEVIKLDIEGSVYNFGNLNINTWLSPDGTNFVESFNYNNYETFTMSTPYDMSTATFVTGSNHGLGSADFDGLTVSIFQYYGMTWGNNGFRFYRSMTSSLGTVTVMTDVSIAYDLSSIRTPASYWVATELQTQTGYDLRFSNDGKTVIGNRGTSAFMFTFQLPIAWDLKSYVLGSYTQIPIQTGLQIGGFDFNDNGSVIFCGVAGANNPFNDAVAAWNLPTPFDITSIANSEFRNDNFTSSMEMNPTHTNVYSVQYINASPYLYVKTNGGTANKNSSQWVRGDSYYTGDLNPAHILRECITSPDFGMGFDSSVIDDVSFMAAADTLYDEKMGMSLLLTDELTIQEFMQEIVRHIDATIYIDKSTGLFKLKLIRDDYIIGNLPVFDETNISRVEEVNRTAFGELVNSVTVTYYNLANDEDRTVTVQDIALIQETGEVNDTALMYTGFTNPVIASKIAQRDLNSLSVAIRSMVIFVDRSASNINVSDPVFIDWPDLSINGVYRITEIAYGEVRSNKIRLKVTEDIFSFPQNSLLTVIEPEWTDTIVPAVAVVDFYIIENSYYELVKKWRQNETDQELVTNPNFGQVTTAGASPASSMLNAGIWIDDGGGYTQFNSMPFCPIATLAADIDKTIKTITVSNVILLSTIRIGSYALIDNEYVVIDAITATTATIKRGILDTLPATHLNGVKILFLEDFWTASTSENVTGEILNVKLATYSGSDAVDINTVTATTITMDQRALRPYNAGNLKVNTFYFPVSIGLLDELQLTWAHRNRQQQTGSVHIGFDEPDLTLPAGVTYTLRIYGQTDTLLRTITLLTVNLYTYLSADELSDSGLAQLNTSLRFELETIENSVISREIYNHTVTRV